MSQGNLATIYLFTFGATYQTETTITSRNSVDAMSSPHEHVYALRWNREKHVIHILHMQLASCSERTTSIFHYHRVDLVQINWVCCAIIKSIGKNQSLVILLWIKARSASLARALIYQFIQMLLIMIDSSRTNRNSDENRRQSLTTQISAQ